MYRRALSLGPMETTTVILDIDGTLCDTCAVDVDCFLDACSAALDLDVRGSDWIAAPQITDSGIVHWLWSQHRGRAPFPDEEQAVLKQFMDRLRAEFARSPHRFQAVPGATELFDSPPAGWHLAAATGGWRESALFKLEAAGLPGAILVASSTDARDRVEIFQLAAARVRQRSHSDCQLVLVGDGEWDVRVAQTLGWRFVGIGEGEEAERLRRAGAEHVIRDFTDQLVFQAVVRASRVPIHGARPLTSRKVLSDPQPQLTGGRNPP